LSQTSDTVANGISQEFLDELFRLKEVNSIGKGVEVPDGWAIPKLLQVTLPREAEFKEVQEAVRKDYVESKAADLMQADARKLSEEATKLKDLAQAAQKQGLALKTSASFKRDGAPAPEIGTSTEFSAAAFNTPVGGISEPVNVAAGKYVAVLQVKTRSPINETEYAKQKPVLREQALSSVREAYFLEYINRVTDELQKARKIKVSQQALDRITGGR
jgi:parvulin-like peptidyl-prolyl isomerase